MTLAKQLLWILATAGLISSCARRLPEFAHVQRELPESGNVAPLTRDEQVAELAARQAAAFHLAELRRALGMEETPTDSPAATPVTASPQKWTFIGPRPIVISTANPLAGSVLHLLVDPHNSSTLYAVTYLGRLWKTTDAAKTWTPLSDDGPLVAIEWLTADPKTANLLYAMDAGTLFKSTDGGTKWTALPALPSAANGCTGQAFAIHPSVSGTWLASAYCAGKTNTSEIYKTTDSGQAWTKVSSITGEINQIGFNDGTPAYAYASGFNANAAVFEVSTDTGSTWKAAVGTGATALPQKADNNFNRVHFAAAPTNKSTIYVRTETYTGDTMMILYKTTDAGATWKQTAYTPEKQGPRTPALTAVDPTNENIVYAGALNLHRSTDGGATWTDIYKYNGLTLHSDHHAMVFSTDGKTAYQSCDGGVWSSTDFRTATVTWTNLNNTFGTAEFEAPLAMDPNDSTRSFGGLQDNNTVRYAGALAWDGVGLGGDGNGNAINPQSTNIVYSLNDSALSRSTQNGDAGTWKQLLPQSSGAHMVMDFSTPTTVYYYDQSTLQQTLDGGDTWNTLLDNGSNVSAMAVSPADSNTVMALAGSFPWLITNALAGVSGANINGGLAMSAASPVPTIHALRADPQDPAKFYLLASNGSTPMPLLITHDGGASWQARDLGPNVAEAPKDLVFDPDIPNTWYLATTASVYRSSDAGESWWPLASGFPIINVTSLNLQEGARLLRAATAGRGVWDLAIPATPPLVTNATLTQVDGGYLLTVNGSNYTSDSVILWNGVAQSTLFVSATQLTAIVPSTAVKPSVSYRVSVRTEGAAGGVTDPVSVAFGPTILKIRNYASRVSVTSDVAATSSTADPFAVGVAPGTLISITGTQMADATADADPTAAMLPTTLGNVQVVVNGVAAPLVHVSPQHIRVVVPWETDGAAEASIVVSNNGQSSNTFTAPVEIAPQIFTVNNSGWGQGQVFLAGTTTLASPDQTPAPSGTSITIYATGLGAVQNPPQDGVPATESTPVVTTPLVRVGCVNSAGAIAFCNATVKSAGLLPGSAGMYQITVQLPALVMSGNQVPLQINYGKQAGRSSNIVTIAVQ